MSRYATRTEIKRHNFFKRILDIFILGGHIFRGRMDGWASGLGIGLRYHVGLLGLSLLLAIVNTWAMVVMMMMMMVIMRMVMELMRTILMNGMK